MTRTFGSTLIAAVALASLCRTARADEKGFWDGLAGALDASREARCRTALCWGGDQGNTYALEPLGEIPIGKTVVPAPDSGIGTFINNHDLSVNLAAGLRFWFWKDRTSLSVYFSTPVLEEDASIRIPGSSYEHSSSRIRRPYPGFALGLFGDSLWIGFDYNQLRNGDSDMNRDPNFKRNEVVSQALSFTIAIAPINLARSGFAQK